MLWQSELVAARVPLGARIPRKADASKPDRGSPLDQRNGREPTNDAREVPMFRTIAAAVLFALLPTTAFAGAVGGPESGSTRVNANASDAYVVQFEGGQSATIAMMGDGDTDLDLYVYDENGNLVASDVGTTDAAFVSWTPKWTGAFRIEVKNRGNVYNAYTIVTN